MKSVVLFKKSDKKIKPGRFSDFFLHASEKEKKDILEKAAHKANADQRKLVKNFS